MNNREHRWYAYFENCPVPLAVVDEGGRIVDSNLRLRELSGKRKEQLDGASLGDGLGCVYRRSNETGCGHSPHCTDCELRGVVNKASFGGPAPAQKELLYTREREDRVEVIPFRTSAASIALPAADCSEESNRLVIMAIEDNSSSDHREKENEQLLIEMNHRIKNNLANVEALVHMELANPSKSKEDSLNDIIGRVQAIGVVHELLSTTIHFAAVDMNRYIEELAGKLLETQQTGAGDRSYTLHFDVAPLSFSPKTTTMLGLIFAELMTNTFKYAVTGPACVITFTLRKERETVFFIYRDSGSSLQGTTTTLRDLPEGTGLLLIKEMVRSLAGEIELNTADGTQFRITFPV